MQASESGDHGDILPNGGHRSRHHRHKGKHPQHEETAALRVEGAESVDAEKAEREQVQEPPQQQQQEQEQQENKSDADSQNIGSVVEEFVSRLPAGDAVRATSEKARKLATEGKQLVKDVLENSNIRAVASGCVAKGKQVVDGARAYQHTAMEVAAKTVPHCRKPMEMCAATARSTVNSARSVAEKSTRCVAQTGGELRERAKSYVETMKSIRGKLFNFFEASKPRVAEVQRTGMKAVGERDLQLFVTALAQATACVVVLSRVITVEMCKVNRVNSTMRYIQGSTCMRLGASLWNCINPSLVQHVPVVGERVASAAAAFVAEVKQYTSDDRDDVQDEQKVAA
ncbi:uncharacterized protein TEOVI_000626300 [Trypanosoma equiperdum]|uniref:Uncharacterized protein n=2 Tax=Trypanozoon TaxID=39700 RepID=Q57XQ8_TRYB2|nr:hypothetical protein, conserved [Trypanosoma brucei brucei TREU927]AAX69611.1 hypothetical protein, conserved [Trypanosoma brucei]AAZ12280.1 hypothetical protein, conserved [Trypanosoma brucei brucei TREU927]SCU67896.1 hypothetical protein, conserved [Trypanosoma equiperdum]